MKSLEYLLAGFEAKAEHALAHEIARGGDKNGFFHGQYRAYIDAATQLQAVIEAMETPND